MSAWKKPTAAIVLAWADRNFLQVPAARCGAGSDSGFLEDLPDGRRDLVPETRQLTADPPVASGRVVASHLQHKPADRRASTGPSGYPALTSPAAFDQAGVPVGRQNCAASCDDQATVPPQDGSWRDQPMYP